MKLASDIDSNQNVVFGPSLLEHHLKLIIWNYCHAGVRLQQRVRLQFLCKY